MENNYQSVENYTKPKKRISLKIAIAISLLSFMFGAGSVIAVIMFAGNSVDANQLSVMQAMSLTKGRFVGSYDWDVVTDKTLSQMVNTLDDRWSYYLTEEEYQRKLEMDANEFVGIGVSISVTEHDAIYVMEVTKDGPAYKAGIRANEAIIAVEDIFITEETWQEAIGAIAGDAGTTISLLVQNKEKQFRWVDVTRAIIHPQLVTYRTVTDEIGLIRIESFIDDTGEAFVEAVNKLENKGVTSIIFDVRNNPGGYVKEVIHMLDHIVPQGKLFYSEDIDGEVIEYYSDQNYVDLSYAVLVNENSYSAAEFLAGQLQEMNCAVVIGESTIGKGYAQQVFPLPNGGAIGISTSEYYTGSGRSLADVGVTPDEFVALTQEQNIALMSGQLEDFDDKQLQKAIEYLKQ